MTWRLARAAALLKSNFRSRAGDRKLASLFNVLVGPFAAVS